MDCLHVIHENKKAVFTLDPYILILSVSIGVLAIMILAFSILLEEEEMEWERMRDERKR